MPCGFAEHLACPQASKRCVLAGTDGAKVSIKLMKCTIAGKQCPAWKDTHTHIYIYTVFEKGFYLGYTEYVSTFCCVIDLAVLE